MRPPPRPPPPHPAARAGCGGSGDAKCCRLYTRGQSARGHSGARAAPRSRARGARAALCAQPQQQPNFFFLVGWLVARTPVRIWHESGGNMAPARPTRDPVPGRALVDAEPPYSFPPAHPPRKKKAGETCQIVCGIRTISHCGVCNFVALTCALISFFFAIFFCGGTRSFGRKNPIAARAGADRRTAGGARARARH